MKRVILDCDGVMVDFVSGYLALLNKHGGTRYGHDDISDWDICENLQIPQDVQDKAHREVDHKFCADLQAIAGAVPGVRAILASADVLFLTSPWHCLGWTDARRDWLRERFGKGIKVMHGSAKDWVDADVFVDDKTSTVVEWAKAHPGKTAVLWAQPWNATAPAGDYIRTNEWGRLLELCK